MAGTDTLNGIQTALIGASIGQKTDSSADWMIYVGFMQDNNPASTTKIIADRAICLYETPGRPPLEAWAIDYPGFQVMVRGNSDDYTAARNKIHDVFKTLHAGEAAVGADIVYLYATQSAPLSMGVDEKRRPRLAMNFRMMRNRPA